MILKMILIQVFMERIFHLKIKVVLNFQNDCEPGPDFVIGLSFYFLQLFLVKLYHSTSKTTFHPGKQNIQKQLPRFVRRYKFRTLASGFSLVQADKLWYIFLYRQGQGRHHCAD